MEILNLIMVFCGLYAGTELRTVLPSQTCVVKMIQCTEFSEENRIVTSKDLAKCMVKRIDPKDSDG